jgi:hypothetical protein
MNITLHTAEIENARSALAFFVQSSEDISIFHFKQEQARRVPTLRNARRELMSA